MSVARLNVVLWLATVLAAGPVHAADTAGGGSVAHGADPYAGTEVARDYFEFTLTPDSIPLVTGDSAQLLAPRLGDRSLEAGGPRRRGLLSLDWQHALSDAQALTLSAQYSDYGNGESDGPAAGSARAAAVSWSALLGSEARLTGQLFLGDESTRDPGPGLLPRRYYGLLLEGRYAIGREHAPFASLRWQRSDVDNGDLTSDWRRERESRFAAGWAWQIRSDWDLRAEASYRFTEDLPELIEADRARFGVSTRYGFR